MPRTHALRWALAGVVGLGVVLTVTALGQDAADEAEKTEPLLLRMYDVRPLMFEIPDHPLGAATVRFFSTGPWEAPPGSDFADLFGYASAADMGPIGWQELVDVIQRTVNNASDHKVAAWSDEGGPAAIEFMKGTFIISQSRHGHERVKELLEQMRRDWLGPLVRVQARWVAVDADKVDDLIGAGEARQDLPMPVAEDALKKAGAKVLYRCQVTGFNCQTVHVVTSHLETYLADATPVTDEGATRLEPVVGNLYSCAAVQVTPVLLPEGEGVLLDLRAEVVRRVRLRTRPIPQFDQARDGSKTVTIDVALPELLTQMFRTTVKAPLGKALLVAGASEPDAPEGKVLYLVIEVSASK